MIPTQTNDDNSADEHEWPSEAIDAEQVQAWIASVLPTHPRVLGPVEVLQAKEWGVTARFIAVTPNLSNSSGASAEEVVFKAGWLRRFAQAPEVYSLLGRHCQGNVPDLLATAHQGDETWTLFRAFDGPTVESLRQSEPLLDLARTLAHIQSTIADAPAEERQPLPRTPLTLLPMMFDTVLHDVRERHAPFWQITDGQPLAQHFHLPADPATQMAAYRPLIRQWTDELQQGNWPESIDHVDLHWENAIFQPDGRILIYDWEEAALSCPFFSLDRLLDDARELDGLGESGADPSPTERLLRDAYLDALPWHTRDRRERALNLALCLAPIKTAYEGILLAEALDWDEGMPNVTAWALGRALPRWSAIMYHDVDHEFFAHDA
ncbi:MAG: hypothetical protein ACXWQR_19715 [Ktedonobacterales bacterium]